MMSNSGEQIQLCELDSKPQKSETLNNTQASSTDPTTTKMINNNNFPLSATSILKEINRIKRFRQRQKDAEDKRIQRMNLNRRRTLSDTSQNVSTTVLDETKLDESKLDSLCNELQYDAPLEFEFHRKETSDLPVTAVGKLEKYPINPLITQTRKSIGSDTSSRGSYSLYYNYPTTKVADPPIKGDLEANGNACLYTRKAGMKVGSKYSKDARFQNFNLQDFKSVSVEEPFGIQNGFLQKRLSG